MKRLNEFTMARVGLGRSGASMPTGPVLELRLAHARARDAVHFPLDVWSVLQELKAREWPAVAIHSAAKDRDEYLRRPDLGRLLSESSRASLSAIRPNGKLLFVIADGLSAIAVHRHAVPLLERVFEKLGAQELAAIVVAEQARVAIGDPIGELFGAEVSVVLIGERPGLSAPDSLGVYLTWQPRTGRTDAERNCISNVHAQGLSYEAAALKLVFLICESNRRKLSGVSLKETAERRELP